MHVDSPLGEEGEELGTEDAAVGVADQDVGTEGGDLGSGLGPQTLEGQDGQALATAEGGGGFRDGRSLDGEPPPLRALRVREYADYLVLERDADEGGHGDIRGSREEHAHYSLRKELKIIPPRRARGTRRREEGHRKGGKTGENTHLFFPLIFRSHYFISAVSASFAVREVLFLDLPYHALLRRRYWARALSRLPALSLSMKRKPSR